MRVAGFEPRTMCVQNRDVAGTVKTSFDAMVKFIALYCHRVKLKLKLKIVTNVKVDSFVVFYGGP